jgi:hypothetical protein
MVASGTFYKYRTSLPDANVRQGSSFDALPEDFKKKSINLKNTSRGIKL